MEEKRAENIQSLQESLTEDLLTELKLRLYAENKNSKKVLEYATNIELALFISLDNIQNNIQTGDKYKKIEELLRPLQSQLRIPKLYDLVCRRADIAGAKYIPGKDKP